MTAQNALKLSEERISAALETIEQEGLQFAVFASAIPAGPEQMATVLFIELSIPGPVLGQRLKVVSMSNDLLVAEEQASSIVLQMLQQLRGQFNEVLNQSMSVGTANGNGNGFPPGMSNGHLL